MSRVVNLKLDKVDWAGQAKIFKWTEPGHTNPDRVVVKK